MNSDDEQSPEKTWIVLPATIRCSSWETSMEGMLRCQENQLNIQILSETGSTLYDWEFLLKQRWSFLSPLRTWWAVSLNRRIPISVDSLHIETSPEQLTLTIPPPWPIDFAWTVFASMSEPMVDPLLESLQELRDEMHCGIGRISTSCSVLEEG